MLKLISGEKKGVSSARKGVRGAQVVTSVTAVRGAWSWMTKGNAIANAHLGQHRSRNSV